MNSTDGTLEVHTFWPHGCYDHYKRLRYYCAPSKGVKVAANVGGKSTFGTGQNLWVIRAGSWAGAGKKRGILYLRLVLGEIKRKIRSFIPKR